MFFKNVKLDELEISVVHRDDKKGIFDVMTIEPAEKGWKFKAIEGNTESEAIISYKQLAKIAHAFFTVCHEKSQKPKTAD